MKIKIIDTPQRHFVYRSLRKVLMKIAKKFADYPFISQTKKTYNFLKNNGIESIFIPPAEKRRFSNEKREHILYVGKLIESKNPLLFLKIAGAFPENKFIMIGSGAMEKEIKEEISKMGLKNVKLINRVKERERLFDYYKKAKLLIHPAHKDPIGFVVIEALSTGTPVISSEKTGASGFLPKKWIVRSSDEKEWIRKVRDILDNEGKSIELAKKTFMNEHLDIDDEYFDKVALKLVKIIKKKWLHIFMNEENN